MRFAKRGNFRISSGQRAGQAEKPSRTLSDPDRGKTPAPTTVKRRGPVFRPTLLPLIRRTGYQSRATLFTPHQESIAIG